MKSAIINGILGSVFTWWFGTHWVGLTTEATILTVIAANIAAPISLLVTLWAERQPAIKKPWLDGAARTWIFVTIVYSSILALIVPELRSVSTLPWMVLPSLWSTGFGILAFGPLQDRVVRRLQRKAREARAAT